MPIPPYVSSLAVRIATEFKAVRTSIGALTGLGTTNKSSIVAAINEVNLKADTAAESGGATNLDQLTDVAITSPAIGHILQHNGTGNFVNVPGTSVFEPAGAANSARDAAIAASQPLDSDLTAIAALTTTAYGRAFLALANQAGLMGLVVQSSTSAAGKVQLATTAEATTGTDATKAVTPAALSAAVAAQVPAATETVAGRVELATLVEAAAGSDSTRAVTPAALGALKAAVKNEILGAGVPAALDTLDELAAALGDDPNFAASITTALGNKQPLDADLTSIASLASAANKMLYATGAGTWALADLTPLGRTLLAGASAAAMRGTLDVYSKAEIGDPETDYVAVFEAALL